MRAKQRVLLVDDQKLFLEALEFETQLLGLQPTAVGSGREAIDLALKGDFDLIVSDVHMPGCSGRDLLVAVRAKKGVHPPLMLVTGYTDVSFMEAYDLGADAFLSKPFVRKDFQAVIFRLLTPVDRRFAESCGTGPIKVIEGKFAPQQFQLGRGGFCVSGLVRPATEKVGQVICFDLQLWNGPLTSFKGIGVIRWFETGADENSPSTAGIEILSLAPECNGAFVAFLSRYKPVPFIPRFTHSAGGAAA